MKGPKSKKVNCESYEINDHFLFHIALCNQMEHELVKTEKVNETLREIRKKKHMQVLLELSDSTLRPLLISGKIQILERRNTCKYCLSYLI